MKIYECTEYEFLRGLWESDIKKMQRWGTALNCTKRVDCVRVRKSSVVDEKIYFIYYYEFSDVLNQQPPHTPLMSKQYDIEHLLIKFNIVIIIMFFIYFILL